MTARSLVQAHHYARHRVAFRLFRRRRQTGVRHFAAQWLAFISPCQRFSGVLAGASASLGTGVTGVCHPHNDYFIRLFMLVLTDVPKLDGHYQKGNTFYYSHRLRSRRKIHAPKLGPIVLARIVSPLDYLFCGVSSWSICPIAFSGYWRRWEHHGFRHGARDQYRGS